MKHLLLLLARHGLVPAALAMIVCSSVYANNWIVTMEPDSRFHPDSLTVVLGDSVTWVNNDALAHTSTSGNPCTPDGDWDSGTLNQGESFTYVTDAVEDLNYFCSFHCQFGMVGKLIVTNLNPAEERTWGKVKALYRAETSPR